MDNKNKLILVPWDFSQVAKYALLHAINFSKKINCGVALLHVVKKLKEMASATEKLNTYAEEIYKEHKIKPSVIVREGSIFTVISEVADEYESPMVIMGTHGMKGMQKFTGSWALKVITGTKSPFVVVQAPPQSSEINSIVLPINFKSEDKEKIIWIDYLSKLYNTKIYILRLDISDLGIKKKTLINLKVAQKYLNEKNIEYEIITRNGSDLAIESIKFADEIKASLILIMTTKNIRFQDYVLGAAEQQIIANDAKIPVMCVNPREDLTKLGGFGL